MKRSTASSAEDSASAAMRATNPAFAAEARYEPAQRECWLVRAIQSTASTPISRLHEPASRRAPITMPKANGAKGKSAAHQR
jgi:hypothetical protein